jgi:hypothetical protein
VSVPVIANVLSLALIDKIRSALAVEQRLANTISRITEVLLINRLRQKKKILPGCSIPNILSCKKPPLKFPLSQQPKTNLKGLRNGTRSFSTRDFPFGFSLETTKPKKLHILTSRPPRV